MPILSKIYIFLDISSVFFVSTTLITCGKNEIVVRVAAKYPISDSSSIITLITRPRRFGKTINIMMLKYWFEAYQGKFTNVELRMSSEEKSQLANRNSTIENSFLFHHLKIWELGEEYTKHCGKYPIIFLTFKDVKEKDWK